MVLMDPHAADPKPARGEEGEPTPHNFDELDLRLFWIRCVASLFCADPLRVANGSLKLISYAIDMLVVLQEKPTGNLSDEESKELETIIPELRSRYVQITELMAQQATAGVAPEPGASLKIPGMPEA